MVQKFKTLADAIALAEFAHRNQTDKAGLPYIDHPMRVLRAVQGRGCQPYVQMAAVLHDVTEDTAFTLQMLRELGFSEAVVQLVALVDRNESRRLYEFAKADDLLPEGVVTADDFYYHGIRNNKDAGDLKEEDVRDNMLPWRRAYLLQETQDRLAVKYANTLEKIGRAS